MSVVSLSSPVVDIPIGAVSPTSLTQVRSQSDAGCFATGRAGVHIGGAMVFYLTGRSCRSCSCGVTVSRSQHAAHRQAPGTVPLAINFSRPSEVKEFAFVVCTKSFGAGPRLGGPMLLGGCPWCRKEEKGSHLREHGISPDIIY